MSQAIELVLTPVVFGVVGVLLDRVLGTGRVLTVVFVGFGIVGTFVVSYFRYEARIAAAEHARLARSKAES